MDIKTLEDYEILLKDRENGDSHIVLVQEKSDIDFMAGTFSFKKRKGNGIVFQNKKNIVQFSKFPTRLQDMIEKDLAVLVIMEVTKKTLETGRGNLFFPIYTKQ